MERKRQRVSLAHMLQSVVCWGVAGAGARNNVVGSQGSRVEDLQNVMDPPTAEEPLGSRAESRCGWEGRRDVERCV